MSFKKYIENVKNEGVVSMRQRISQQADFSDKDFRKHINIGDLVHFGFDTKTGGKRTTKYGVITHTDSTKAVVYQFNDDKYKELPLEQLIYIRYNALPAEVLINAQRKLPSLFPAGKAPEFDYIGAVKGLTGELDDTVKAIPKALMRLTPKQLARFKNKVPSGAAPMMSPNDLLAFLSQKDPQDREAENPFLKSFKTIIKEPKQPTILDKPVATSPLKAFVVNSKAKTEPTKPLTSLLATYQSRKKIEKPSLDTLLGEK